MRDTLNNNNKTAVGDLARDWYIQHPRCEQTDRHRRTQTELDTNTLSDHKSCLWQSRANNNYNNISNNKKPVLQPKELKTNQPQICFKRNHSLTVATFTLSLRGV